MQAYEAVTVSSSVASLTAGTYAGAVEAFVTVEGPAVRFTKDGTTTPTTTAGVLAQNQDVIHLRTLEQIVKFRATLAVVGSPVVTSSLRVEYENNNRGFKPEDAI